MRRREWFAVDGGAGQIGDEVVAWLGLSLGDQRIEVRVERVLGCDLDSTRVLQDAMDESAEQVAILLGHAQHVGDDPHRDVLRVLHRRVDGVGPGGEQIVDELVAHDASRCFELGDRLRRERREQELASDLVERGV